MATDTRPSFPDALFQFKQFMKQEGWSPDCVWIARNRVKSSNRNLWIFRPQELYENSIGERFYNEILGTKSSIKLLALGRLEGRSVVCVEEYFGDPGCLYMSLTTSPIEVHPVESSFSWIGIRLLSLLRKPMPLLRDIHLPHVA